MASPFNNVKEDLDKEKVKTTQPQPIVGFASKLSESDTLILLMQQVTKGYKDLTKLPTEIDEKFNAQCLQLGYLNRNTRIPNAIHHTILGDRTNTHQGVSNQALMLQQFGRTLFLKSSLTAKQVIGNPATTEKGRELMNLFG